MRGTVHGMSGTTDTDAMTHDPGDAAHATDRDAAMLAAARDEIRRLDTLERRDEADDRRRMLVETRIMRGRLHSREG